MSRREGEASSAAAERLLGQGYQGAVYLRETPTGPVIVKKPTGRGPLRTLRRAMLRREYGIYQRLQNVRGVPRCDGLIDGEALLLEYIVGPSLRDVRPLGEARRLFFAELLTLIRAMHRAGVAHGDLKRKDNILVADGRPVLIDFGTAVTVDERAGFFRRWLFRQVRRMDLNAWVKLKYQRQPGEIDPADAKLHRPTLSENIARAFRRPWRALTRRRFRGRR